MNARYVRLTFCVASSGFSFARSATTRAMSTSMALVTCAAVSTDRRMCSMTPRRIAVIGSSDSPGARAGASVGAAVAATGTGAVTGGGAAAGVWCGCSGWFWRSCCHGRRLGWCGSGRRRWLRSCGDGLGSGSGSRGRRRRRGRRGRRRCCSARLDEGHDVLLRDSPAGAGARNGRGVDAVLGGDARNDRGDECLSVPCGGGRDRRGCGGRLGGRCGSGSRRRWSGRHRLGRRRHGLGGGGSRLDGRRRDASWRDDGEDRPDLDRLTLLHEDLSDDSLCRARHLGVDLVRGDLQQRLVAADRLADLLEPLRDRSFGDGDAHLGHHDFGLGSCRHRSS